MKNKAKTYWVYLNSLMLLLIAILIVSCEKNPIRTRDLTAKVTLPTVRCDNDTVDFVIDSIKLLDVEIEEHNNSLIWIENAPRLVMQVTIKNKTDKPILLRDSEPFQGRGFIGIYSNKVDTLSITGVGNEYIIAPNNSINLHLSERWGNIGADWVDNLSCIDSMLEMIKGMEFYYIPQSSSETSPLSDNTYIELSNKYRLRTTPDTRITSRSLLF